MVPPDLQQILSQALSFLLLLWVLKRFAWKPLLGVLDARRARIEEDLRQAAATKDEMRRAQEELVQRLAKINEEAREKIQAAVQDGRRMASEIQEDARAQAQAILAKSNEAIALELAKAKVSLRDEIADMTVDAVERILRQRCDTDADRKLIASIIDELGEPTG